MALAVFATLVGLVMVSMQQAEAERARTADLRKRNDALAKTRFTEHIEQHYQDLKVLFESAPTDVSAEASGRALLEEFRRFGHSNYSDVESLGLRFQLAYDRLDLSTRKQIYDRLALLHPDHLEYSASADRLAQEVEAEAEALRLRKQVARAKEEAARREQARLRELESKAQGRSDDVHGAWVYMQLFVKRQLKSPKTASFRFGGYRDVRPLGAARYEVNSYVDSQNGFGALIRTQFRGVIVDKGGSWELESLVFD